MCFSDLYNVKNGLNKEKEAFGKGTPIINFMDVYENRVLTLSDLKGKVTVTNNEINNFKVEKGDLFFTRTSETKHDIAYSSVAIENLPNTVYSGFVLKCHPKTDCLLPEFAAYLFSAIPFRKQLVNNSSYTTRALMSGALLNEMKVTFPRNHDNQKKIAALLLKLDELISTQRKLIEDLNTQMITIIDNCLYSNDLHYSNLIELANNSIIRQVKPKDLLYFEGTKKYLSTTSIFYNKIVSDEGEITYNKRPSRAALYPEVNSVWFAKMKNTIKVFLFNQAESEKYIMSTGFYGFKSINEDIMPSSWLKYIFLSKSFNEMKDKICEGSSMSSLKDDLLGKISIPLYNGKSDLLKLLNKLDTDILLQEDVYDRYKIMKNYLLNFLFE